MAKQKAHRFGRRHPGRLCAACLLLAATAHAETITLTAANESLALPWPEGAAEAGGEFGVELDDYDITAVVDIDARRLLLPLRSLALAPGLHQLRATRADPSGERVTVFEISLDVFLRPGVRQASREWNVLLSNAWRLAVHPQSAGGPDDSQSGATLQWGGIFEASRWQARDSVDALYSGHGAGLPGSSVWQLPSYELLAQRQIGSGSLGLALGDDGVPVESLLFSGFNRRGLRIDASAFERRVQWQAFTLHTDPVTTANADLVPSDSSSSMLGSFASVAPLRAHPDALMLSAGWVDGQGSNGGAGVATPEGTLRTGGNAWNAAIDSYAWQRALWLHGEYAHSEFDGDGSGIRSGDDATLVTVQLSSAGAIRFDALDQWALGVEQREVGLNFFALSNLLLPNDLATRRYFLQLGRRGFSFEANMLEQRSDVDDQPLHPRIDTDARSATVRYAPMWADATRTPWRWLGTPALTLSVERTTNVQMDGEAPALGFDVDNLQRALISTLQFSGERFGFGFDYSWMARDDRSHALFADGFLIFEPVDDTREHAFGVNAYWRAGDRLSIGPQWQRVRRHELESGALTHNDLWSLQLQAALIPDVLSLQASWSDARDSVTAVSPLSEEQRSSNSGGAFDLDFRPALGAGPLRPLLDCHVRATYANSATLFAQQSSSLREWQISLSLDLTWAKGN